MGNTLFGVEVLQLYSAIFSSSVNSGSREVAVVAKEWEDVVYYWFLEISKVFFGKVCCTQSVDHAGEPNGFIRSFGFQTGEL